MMKTMKKDTIVTVKHILGQTAEVLVEPLGDKKYRFKCDAYVKGETCTGGFFHLRQARRVIPGKKLGNNFKKWPRLRKALHVAGVKPANIPGGALPIHYQDELVIPDYSMSGTHYFIIKRADINKYLEMLPLDEKGKARAEYFEKVAAEEYRRAHDPKCIAERIGNTLWYSTANNGIPNVEFDKITLVADDDSEFSVIYPSCSTDLLWRNWANVPKVVCTAPEETGIDFLSGYSAGHLDPRKHYRLKKMYAKGWNCDVAYLMPDPKLATEVRDHHRWLDIFDCSDNDGVSLQLILRAKKIILEYYDINDVLIKERFVYSRDSGKVTKEILHNWPFDVFNNKTSKAFDWQVSETE